MKSTLRRLLINNFLTRYLILYPIFWVGYYLFRRRGKTPWLSYFAFRQLYGQTRGGLNRRVSGSLARRARPLQVGEPRGVATASGDAEAELGKALAALRSDGYYVFPTRLPPEQCTALRAWAEQTPCRPTSGLPGAAGRLVFDPAAPKAPTYNFDEDQLLTQPVVQSLLADRSLIELAQRYLGGVPINDLVAMWWSAPFGGQRASEAAQLYHFDMDRLRFLKVFIYLTDVGPDNGPHCYVRGTHERKPDPFFEDRRFGDAEVAAAFPPDSVVEVVGPTGMIIAGDTACLHKGKPVDAGTRLVFQLEFTNSLFGAEYGRLPLPADASADLRRLAADFPAVFQRFAA